MGFSYRVRDQQRAHFVTFTIHQWVDVFTRKIYADILIDSLHYCVQNKGLQIYAYVIMSNHCHLIIQASSGRLSDIIRDIKRHTAAKIIDAIKNNYRESRQSWLLYLLKNGESAWFWNEGYHGEEIRTRKFLLTKIRYIHLNPVRAGIVQKEEDYLLSSAADFNRLRKGPVLLTEF